VWSTDIRTSDGQGFVYLVAVMDWFSRSSELVAVADPGGGVLCGGAEAGVAAGRPDIFNRTGFAFTARVYGSWRAPDRDQHGGGALHGHICRAVWRSLKYRVLLEDYASVTERDGHRRLLRFYNHERLHQASITGRRRRYCMRATAMTGQTLRKERASRGLRPEPWIYRFRARMSVLQ